MSPNKLFILEPSKVATQHITFLTGYLNALIDNRSINKKFSLVFEGSKSTVAALPRSVKDCVPTSTVWVMNPERRRLIRKSFLEFFVILFRIIKMKAGDALIVTCALPPTVIMLEFANYLIRKRDVSLVLHGELEGLCKEERESIKRIGYWAQLWAKLRPVRSRISLIVLDEFIKDRLYALDNKKFSAKTVSVIPQPILAFQDDREAPSDEAHTVCFIGYRVQHKGFSTFRELAKRHAELQFVAIGGGLVENVITGETKKLDGQQEYMAAISNCVAALFPYESGYSCSLSGAAVDALSAGVQVVAFNQPFFLNLEKVLGRDVVTVVQDRSEMSGWLSKAGGLAKTKQLAERRLAGILQSKYSTESVGTAFEQLLADNRHEVEG